MPRTAQSLNRPKPLHTQIMEEHTRFLESEEGFDSENHNPGSPDSDEEVTHQEGSNETGEEDHCDHGSDEEEEFSDLGHDAPPLPPGGHEYEPQKKVQRGKFRELKQLYEGPKKCVCCINWVEKPPANDHLKKMVTTAKWGQFAVVVRRSLHGHDAVFKIHSVTINSVQILDLLRKHLSNYPGLSLSAEEIQFTPPFQALFHFWSEIVQTAESESEDVKEHFQLLRDVIEPELTKNIAIKENCYKDGKIDYRSVWTLFQPGILIYWENDGHPNIGRLIEGSYSPTYYELRVRQVDFDGTKFGFKEVYRVINRFDGSRSMEDYPMPLDMRTDRDQIIASLVERGRKFENLKGYQFKAYSGKVEPTGASLSSASFQTTLPHNMTGRIIIDAGTYYNCGEATAPSLTPLKEDKDKDEATKLTAPPPMIGTDHWFPPPQTTSCFMSMPPPPPPPGMSVMPGLFKPPPLTTLKDLEPLTEEQLMLCVSHMNGFVLTTKKWCEISVRDVQDITWSNPFDNLVLPNQAKDLLLAFATAKASGDVTFDDFVGGKGKGIIMLLSGSPGVGKTLTGEAIAEKLKVPLYTLSAGELGSIAKNVEAELLSAMDRCSRWNAVLLLDECDVFLEKRELNSLKRNELVSIFLRLVEYYEGIMLLTTNRIQTIDPAFESRIDIAINYAELTPALRHQIWHNFIQKMKKDGAKIENTGFWAPDLEKLSQYELNGRQIKSVVKTAQLLAKSKEEPLGMGHLVAVLSLHRQRKGMEMGMDMSKMSGL